jgi:AsmA protein
MGRTLKYIAIAIGALLVLLLAGIVIFSLLFDPNDYRAKISEQVTAATGREFVIEGDLGLSLFPWLAIELGKTRLGNAEGFGPEPFMTFDTAHLSVQMLPLILRREILVSTATLDGLNLNLAVNAEGVSNWQDLIDGQEAAAEADTPAEKGGASVFDIGGIEVSDARVSYVDAQLGEQYLLSDFDISTGAVRPGEAIDLETSFAFDTQPAGLSGTAQSSTSVAFDSDFTAVVFDQLKFAADINGLLDGDAPVRFEMKAPQINVDTGQSVADVGALTFTVFDLKGRADVEPFSYAGELAPNAKLHIDAFSPRSLAAALDIELPETADPNVLGSLVLDATAGMTADQISLTDLTMKLDDTTFKGELAMPKESGPYVMNLSADKINLDRYMAPVEEDAAQATSDDEPPMEIPVDMIRSLHARGSLTVQQALMGGMQFDNVKLGINSANSKLRVHPITAEFFHGRYQGDIRVDATGDVATISANEQIKDVSLAPLAKSLLERENITGLINGSFVLSGRGNDMDAVQQTLNGDVSFTLSDGTYEGVDLWYQVRRARALFKRETPPEPSMPPRTPFSRVSASGKITNGVMRNEDFLAEMPFMRMSGAGTVDLTSSDVNYSLSGRVFARPEYVEGATEKEIADLTKAVIPLRITGKTYEPKIGVDVEALLTEQVKEDLKNRLLEQLIDDDKDGDPAEEKEKDAEDILKDKLKDLLNR